MTRPADASGGETGSDGASPDESRSVARDLIVLAERGRALVRLPERGRALVRRIPEPLQVRLQQASKHSARVMVEILAGLLVLGLVGIVIGYGRLKQGPVSLDFLVPTIEDAIDQELAGLSVQINDAVIQKDPGSLRVLFRLTDVRLVDDTGAVLAQAPKAAIGLSGAALLMGRIAPGSVDFIGPRMLLFYSRANGLTLRFSKPETESAGGEEKIDSDGGRIIAKQGETVVEKTSRHTAPAGPARPINLIETVTSSFEKARQSRSATSYLTSFGVRDAVVVFEQEGAQTFWKVPDFAIDLQHGTDRSVLTGSGNIASKQGPWALDFRTEQSDARKSLKFSAFIQNLVPKSLAANLPALAALQAFDLPVNAETSVEMSSSGKVSGASANVQVGTGYIRLPWDEEHPLLIDEGQLKVRYDKTSGKVEVLPSELHWGKSRMTLRGAIDPIGDPATARRWTFHLSADGAALAAEQFGLGPVTVDQWSAKGEVDPEAGVVRLTDFVIASGDAAIHLAGTIRDNGEGSPAIKLQGRFSPMPIAMLKQFWPKPMAAGAREWVGERVLAGEILGGTVNIDLPAGALDKAGQGGSLPPGAISLKLAARSLAIRYMPDMPPLRTADAQLDISGERFAMTVPHGWVSIETGERIAVSNGRFEIGNVLKDPAQGRITFDVAGKTAAVAALLNHEPLGYLKDVDVKPADFGGNTTGTFALGLPLLKDVKFADVNLSGKAQLTELKSDSLHEKVSVAGGTVDVAVDGKGLTAQGDVLVNNLAARLDWQRVFGRPDAEQPPMRLSAVLNDADRKKLGLDLGKKLEGPVPMTVSLSEGAGGEKQVSLRADLRDAELNMTQIGWHKPSGTPAVLTLDVVPGSEDQVALRNVKVKGDGINIDGAVTLDGANKPINFYFSDFAFNDKTHIELRGALRDDNVWQIDANGASFDGGKFFSSVLSSNQFSKKTKADDGAPGLDLNARIGLVYGNFDTNMRDAAISVRTKGGELTALDATGKLNGSAPISLKMVQNGDGPRTLQGTSPDAGSAFRLIGFYPRVEGGDVVLNIDLDDTGDGEQNGILEVQNFTVLGDRVMRQVLSDVDQKHQGGKKSGRGTSRSRMNFDQLRVPFTISNGRFNLHDTSINGPLLGATMRGFVDFLANTVQLNGTYVPLYGLNSALGTIPIIGDLLVGRRGEGVIGITFAIEGPLDRPSVLVNPMSALAPGIFRQMFEFTGKAPDSFSAAAPAPPPPPGGSPYSFPTQ